MKDLNLNCAMHPSDVLEATVSGDGIFIDIQQPAQHCDLKLTPTQARELAAWLEQAALEAEQADD